MTHPDLTEHDHHHVNMVAGARVELRAALADAIEATRSTLDALDHLCSGQVYDVEFAESSRAAEDMRAFLADAARMLRAAEALNPCPATK